MNQGDVVELVLDVVHVEEGTKHFERVLVQGVFARGDGHPPLVPGASRNVVQVFFGCDMRGIAAFLISSAQLGRRR